MIKSVIQKLLKRQFSEFQEKTITFQSIVKKLSSANIPLDYKRDLFSKIITTFDKTEQSEHEKTKTESKFIKTSDFTITSENYSEFIKSNPFGTLETFEYKDTQFAILGISYTNIPSQNLWKILDMFKPDLLFVQGFPDDFISDFSLNQRNPKTNHFSNRLFFEQLILKHPLHFHSDLINEILEDVSKHCLEDFSEQFIKNIHETNKPLKSLASRDKLTDKALFVSYLFAELNQIPLVFSDIPDLVLREKVCIDLTLTDLRQILNITTEMIPNNPDLTPDTPLNMTHMVYPESFTFHSDSYTTSLIEYTLKKQQPKRVFVLGGNLQGFSLKAMLNNRKIKTIHENLIVEDFKKSLFQDHSIEVLCEKLAIFDVMKFGRDILNLKISDFPQSMALIQKYSGLEKNDKELRFYYYLHQQMVRKYLERYIETFQSGIQLLEKRLFQKMVNER